MRLFRKWAATREHVTDGESAPNGWIQIARCSYIPHVHDISYMQEANITQYYGRLCVVVNISFPSFSKCISYHSERNRSGRKLKEIGKTLVALVQKVHRNVSPSGEYLSKCQGRTASANREMSVHDSDSISHWRSQWPVVINIVTLVVQYIELDC
jgi:hypothetical protein